MLVIRVASDRETEKLDRQFDALGVTGLLIERRVLAEMSNIDHSAAMPLAERGYRSTSLSFCKTCKSSASTTGNAGSACVSCSLAFITLRGRREQRRSTVDAAVESSGSRDEALHPGDSAFCFLIRDRRLCQPESATDRPPCPTILMTGTTGR